MRNIIIAAIAIASFSTSAMAIDLTNASISPNVMVTKAKKPNTMAMLTAVCPTKAIKSAKLEEACKAHAEVAKLNLSSTVTIKAPGAELKALFANVASFQ